MQALSAILLYGNSKEVVAVFEAAPGDSAEDKCRATWRRFLEQITEPEWQSTDGPWALIALQKLVFTCQPCFYLTGVMERAYGTEFMKLFDQSSLVESDRVDLEITLAGGIFYALLNSTSEPLKMLIVLGLFEGEADWVS